MTLPLSSLTRLLALADSKASQDRSYLWLGCRVEGNYHGRGRLYPGRVTAMHADGTVDIR